VAARLSPGSRPRLDAGTLTRAAAFVLAVASVAALGGCAVPEAVGPTFPPVSIGPSRTVSPAVNQTRAELVRALGEANLILADTQAPVRPAEAPLLAGAPRAVYQVTLPEDPTRGFIVVYEFSDASRAADAAAEEQRYLASGPGRVQTPEGTVHVLRQVGSTVVLYDWLPGAAQDPRAPEIQRVLETLGVGFPIEG
jgi:hypothetical protein